MICFRNILLIAFLEMLPLLLVIGEALEGLTLRRIELFGVLQDAIEEIGYLIDPFLNAYLGLFVVLHKLQSLLGKAINDSLQLVVCVLIGELLLWKSLLENLDGPIGFLLRVRDF